MKRTIAIILSLLMIFAVITGCQNKESKDDISEKNNMSETADFEKTQSANHARLSIVTTIFPQYDFTRQIVGDLADVTMLLKPGAESHTYEPTPQDIKLIQDSDLFIYVGGENDTWVDDIIASMGDAAPETMKLVDLVDTFDEEIVDGMEHEHEHEHEELADHDHDHDHDHEELADHEHEHEHEELADHDHDHDHEELADHDHDHEHEHELDEHVWTSPVKAKEIVVAITNKLMEKDSSDAQTFQKNSERYIEKLENLDEQFRDVVKNAKRDTILFGDRFPFRYLVEEYGIHYYAAFSGCSTSTEADASTVAFLIDKTEELQLPYVFSIELSNEKIVDSIVEATDAEKLTLHSIHNLSTEELENGETYISLMQKNVENLAKALQ